MEIDPPPSPSASAQPESAGTGLQEQALPPWLMVAGKYMQAVMKEWERRPPQEGELMGALSSIMDGSLFLEGPTENPAVATLRGAMKTVSESLKNVPQAAAAAGLPQGAQAVLQSMMAQAGAAAHARPPSPTGSQSSATSQSRFPVKDKKRPRRDS